MVSDRRARDRQYNQCGRKRNPDTKFHASAEWKKISRLQRDKQPWCENHLAAGEHVLAESVDHKMKPDGDFTLQRSWDNLMSLCNPCHAYKTRTGELPLITGYDPSGYPIDPRHPANLTPEQRAEAHRAKARAGDPKPESPTPQPKRFCVF